MELTANQIKKYAKYSVPQLRIKAGSRFRKWIRNRDKDKPCISCGSTKDLQAGHFYSAGHHPGLEFNEDNVNHQCLQCNYHLHGNLNEYRKKLIKLIGAESVEELDRISDYFRKHGYKHDRIRLIEILIKYG